MKFVNWTLTIAIHQLAASKIIKVRHPGHAKASNSHLGLWFQSDQKVFPELYPERWLFSRDIPIHPHDKPSMVLH
jgi:hypothetical protein